MNSICSVLLVFALISSTHALFGQAKIMRPGYYVVVGAYAPSKENFASLYANKLSSQGYEATYGLNTTKNMYFVYLNYFTTLKAALRAMQQTRQAGKIIDAWVNVVPGDITPVDENQITPQPIDATTNTLSRKPLAKQLDKDSFLERDGTNQDSIVVTNNPEIKQYDRMTLGNTEVFLSLFHARNNRIVDGDVQVIDTERSKQLTTVKGNEYLLLPDPKSKSGQLTLLCESFGYRKIQHEINYPLPLADTVKPFVDLMGTTIVINFDLVRYLKGDIATLYNVYFYNDAAIMLPESKYELNNLLQMMQENPNYRIKLHGHSNGNYQGKIINMGATKDFFSLKDTQQSIGSAKALSRERAEIIKEYLITQGILPERMEIKAWGGRRPVFDKKGANAKKNVRVEIEILED